MQPSFLIKRPDSSRAGVVQFINLKFYDEAYLLRQCFTISITTIKHPIAGQILDLYNTTDDDRPVFPLPVRDVLWYEVHGMGVALGMKENLSYHMARHSFGTLTLTAGIPIESIARIMGHTNIDSTQVYAQVTDRKISSDMDRLMERRKPAAGKEAAG